MKCSKCNADILDDSIFCSVCGRKVNERESDELGSTKNNSEAKILDIPEHCSSRSSKTAGEVSDVGKLAETKNNKRLRLILVGFAAVIAIVFIAVLFFGNNSEVKYSLYLRDKEMYITFFAENTSVELTSDLLNGDDSIDNMYIPYYGEALSSLTMRSEDGTKLLFPDKIDWREGVILYFYDVTNPEEKPIKIDTDITLYAVNEDFTQIVYYKSNNRSLYRHNVESKEKLAGDVWDFVVSSDLSVIYYENEDDDLFCIQADGSEEKVDSDISDLISITGNFLYYEKGSNLYRFSAETGKEKIDSEFYHEYGNYGIIPYETPNDDFYYYSGAYLPILNFVKNDVDAPSGWEAYFEDHELYVGYVDFAVFEGENKVLLADAAQVLNAYFSKERSIVCYRSYELTDGVVGLAEIAEQYYSSDEDYADIAEALVYDKLEKSIEYCCAINGNIYTIDANNITYLDIDSDNNRIYFVDTSDYEDDKGDLYYCVITDDGLGEPVLLDNDVTHTSIATKTGEGDLLPPLGDAKFVYFKYGADGIGDLYVDGEVLDYDVLIDSVRYDAQTNAFYYLTNWDYDNLCGTLSMHNESQRVKIADDVNSFTINGDGTLLYLADISTESFQGDLFKYKDGVSALLDNDVYSIINGHTPVDFPLAFLAN